MSFVYKVTCYLFNKGQLYYDNGNPIWVPLRLIILYEFLLVEHTTSPQHGTVTAGARMM